MNNIWHSHDETPTLNCKVIVIDSKNQVHDFGFWDYNDGVGDGFKWAYMDDLIKETIKDEDCHTRLRLGVCVSGSKEEITALMDGDHDTLARIVEEGRFVVDGDSYIPADSVAEYNESYGGGFEERDVSV